jgi:hypothetical protein
VVGGAFVKRLVYGYRVDSFAHFAVLSLYTV